MSFEKLRQFKNEDLEAENKKLREALEETRDINSDADKDNAQAAYIQTCIDQEKLEDEIVRITTLL